MAVFQPVEFAPLTIPSEIQEEDLVRVRELYPTSSEFQLEAPGPGDGVCFPLHDRISFYEKCFRAGVRLPLHPFFVTLLRYLEISPCALVPNAWRYICGFTAACVLSILLCDVASFPNL